VASSSRLARSKRAKPRRRMKKRQSWSRRRQFNWGGWGEQYGTADAQSDKELTIQTSSEQGETSVVHHQLQDRWGVRLHASEMLRLPYESYKQAAESYARSYCRLRGAPDLPGLLLPTHLSVCAVATFHTHDAAAERLIALLNALAFAEIVCIVSGDNEALLQKLRRSASTTIIYVEEKLTPAGARKLGARVGNAEVLLFLDDRVELEPAQLLAFLRAIEEGADIAICDTKPKARPIAGWNIAEVTRGFLNLCMGHKDLDSGSMQNVPHAITKRACQSIGMANLGNPAMFQTLAVMKGLELRRVDIMPSTSIAGSSLGTDLAAHVQGHLDAMRILVQQRGPRLHYPDDRRSRSIAGEEASDADD